MRETLRSQNPSAETLRDLEEHLSSEEAAGTRLVDDDGLWDVGAVRIFLSHSAEHKEFVAEVADALRLWGTGPEREPPCLPLSGLTIVLRMAGAKSSEYPPVIVNDLALVEKPSEELGH